MYALSYANLSLFVRALLILLSNAPYPFIGLTDTDMIVRISVAIKPTSPRMYIHIFSNTYLLKYLYAMHANTISCATISPALEPVSIKSATLKNVATV